MHYREIPCLMHENSERGWLPSVWGAPKLPCLMAGVRRGGGGRVFTARGWALYDGNNSGGNSISWNNHDGAYSVKMYLEPDNVATVPGSDTHCELKLSVSTL